MICSCCKKDKKRVSATIPDVNGKVCCNCRRQWRVHNEPGLREKFNKQKNSWSSKNRESRRNTHLKVNFGITSEEYEAKLLAQGGGCAVCGKLVFRKKTKALHVDHDHKTGKVRGLLCHNCNLGIGRFFDNITLLEKAIVYLKLWSADAISRP